MTGWKTPTIYSEMSLSEDEENFSDKANQVENKKSKCSDGNFKKILRAPNMEEIKDIPRRKSVKYSAQKLTKALFT